MTIAETSRIRLTKISLNDAPFILKLMTSPKWLKYIGDRNVKTVEEAKTYIENNQLKSYQTHGFGYYKIELKTNDLKPIGTCGLVKRAQLEHIDVGFSLLPNYEGKGYAFEATNALLKLAKKEFNIENIIAITLPENKSSIQLLEKLGLSYEKTVKPFEDDEELLLFEKTL
ncbi:GNAT family N-acetyltransferase [uncultured Psychroserpens sp.]|uniref:GNAT family N-acetyltransferase n=1 Tax=uncultured Psychroserpens sp. TaxID=255436 RepID=UPI00261A5805|nr:GNAT family N-acetyltransferase [uncultured Psychroserpens sp.]